MNYLHNISYELIYIISSVVTIVAFLFVAYHKKHFRFCAIATLFLMSAAQLFYRYLPIELSDMMYDIAFILASVAIVKCGLYIKTIKVEICPLASECKENPNNLGRRKYDKKKCDDCDKKQFCEHQ